MAAKNENQISLDVPDGDYGDIIFANRCTVSTFEGNWLLSFTLVREEKNDDVLSILLDSNFVSDNRSEWLGYFAKLSKHVPTKELIFEEDRGSFRSHVKKLSYSNWSTLSFKGNLAEFRFCVYSGGAAMHKLREKPSGASIAVQSIALVISPIQVQASIISRFYEDQASVN